jgi:hypothetical protein
VFSYNRPGPAGIHIDAGNVEELMAKRETPARKRGGDDEQPASPAFKAMLERLTGAGAPEPPQPIEDTEQQLLPHDADYGELRSNAVYERDEKRDVRRWVVVAVLCVIAILVVIKLL